MKKNFPHRLTAGFSLVEVTLALGIAAFCLVAILGMLPVGLSTSQNAVSQTAAVSVLRAVAADLKDTPVGTPLASTQMTSTFYKFQVPDTTGKTIYLDESGSVVTQAQARFKVTVKTVYTAGAARNATRDQVVIAWPPLAAYPAGTLESIIALDRN